MLLRDAKDVLEAAKLMTEPVGVLTGTTNTVKAGAGQTFTAERLLAPKRCRPATGPEHSGSWKRS